MGGDRWRTWVTQVFLGVALAAGGCGPLLYPAGTFYSGCFGESEGAPGSVMAGTWWGPVEIRVTDQAADTVDVSAGHITVAFDALGRPMGSGGVWPERWPACWRVDARVARIVNACGDDPFRIPPQQSIETVTLRDVVITPTSLSLDWSRWYDEALCPDGKRPTVYEHRLYELRVEGERLLWSLTVEYSDDWSWGTYLDESVITEMTGELERVPGSE